MLKTVFFLWKINMSKFTIVFLVLLNLGKESFATNLSGARAKTGQFPWLIQFQTIAPCGGILLSPDWVLTAAQCVQYNRNSISLFASGLNGTGSRQTMGVKATYIFPQYQAYSTFHDHEHNIALIKLSEPFDMCDDQVQLLEVAPLRLDDDYKTCLIFGWQSYVAPSSKVLAKPIQYSRVVLNAWKRCTYIFEGNTSYSNVFCAMVDSEDGVKACAGNPGSPVICRDKYQRMIILGIASWSNFTLDCDGLPIYLGVSVFRSWIDDIIFSDRKNQEWYEDSTKVIPKGICGRDRYLGAIQSATSMRNYSDSLASEYQAQYDRRMNLQMKPGSMKGLQEREILHGENDYSVISLKNKVPFDILKERDDKLKQYHEVGGSEEALGGKDDLAIESPMRESKVVYFRQQNGKIISPVTQYDESDDLEFVVPLDEDYFIGRSYSFHFCSRKFLYIRITLLVSLFSLITKIF